MYDSLPSRSRHRYGFGVCARNSGTWLSLPGLHPSIPITLITPRQAYGSMLCFELCLGTVLYTRPNRQLYRQRLDPKILTLIQIVDLAELI